MNKAVVFDLDGTLIDSLGDITAALNILLEQEGVAALPPEKVQLLVGGGVVNLIKAGWDMIGRELPDDQVQPLVSRFEALYLASPAKHTIVFEGVPVMLQALRKDGWSIGICTNKPDIITTRVLADVKLDQWVDAVVGGDFPNRKPHGDHVLETLRRMNADPKTSVYVGDSGTDVAAARNAGLPVAVVNFGYAHTPVAELGADWIIEAYDDPTLPNKLAAISSRPA
jgi:phosphoglycolate phosphatase